MEMHDGGRRARMGSASRIACRGVAALAFASCAARAAPADVPVLVDGSRIERRLPGDAQDRVIVDASRGPLVVIVEQIGVDLVLRCDNEAHGRNAPTGRLGPEVVLVDRGCDLSIRARNAGMPQLVYRARAFSVDGAEGRRLPRRVWALWSAGHYESGADNAQGDAEGLEKLREVERAVASLGGDDVRYLRFGNALLLRRLERNDEAIAAYDALTRDLDPKRHGAWFARANNGKGLALRELNRFDDADHAFAEAVRYGAGGNEPYEWVSAQNNRCLILHHYGRLAAARDCYAAVIPRYRKAAANQVAVPMLNLAAAADTLGEPALALKNYRAALELRRAGSDRRSLGIVLLNLANHEARTGAWPDAIAHSLEAQQIFEGLGDRPRSVNVLMLRGWIYRELREPRRAREYLEEAVRIAQASNDRNAIAMAKSAFARQDPDAAAAAKAHREVVAYLVETRQSGLAIQEWLMLAERLDETGAAVARDAALAACDTLLQSNGSRSSLADVAMLRGRVALREGRIDDAQRHVTAALALRRQTREAAGYADALLLKARVARRYGLADAALADIEQALDELARAERLPGSPVLAASLYDRRVELLDEAMDVLLGGGSPDAAAMEKAWSLKWRFARAPDGQRAPADANERALVDELRAKVMLLSDARSPGYGLSRPRTPQQIAELSRRVDEIESQLDARRVDTRVAAPPLGLAAAAAALRPDDALIAINLGARTSGAWVGTAAAVRWIALPTRTELLGAIQNVLELQSVSAFDALSRQLAPLMAATASARRVLILPDGPSNLIPFAGLADGDGKYWIERSTIVLLSAPPSKAAQLQPSALDRGFSVVVWGGSATLDAPTRARTGTSVFRSGTDMAELPAIGVEIDVIKQLLGEQRIAYGDPDDVAAPDTPHWVLHIAGHGLANSGHPYATALALPKRDGTGFTFLGTRSVALGPHPPSLVVVNVCEGFAGRLFDSQPPPSLARRFLDAGAGSVVAASWPIEDSRAARFAQLLYAELERDSTDIADALARAQRAALRAGGSRGLRNWSGYSVIRSGG